MNSKRSIAAFVTAMVAAATVSFAQGEDPAAGAKAHLGKRLFNDKRLSNPGSDWDVSCANCHVPPDTPGKERMYADDISLSLLPSSAHADKALAQRNTPTLLDAGKMQRLNWDGRFGSLDEVIKSKITGIHFGWGADQAKQALDEIANMVKLDTGEDKLGDGPYKSEFKKAYGVDIDAASNDEAVTAVVTALKDFTSSIQTTVSSNYDAFAYMNRIQKYVDIAGGDTPADFAGRVEGNLMNQEGRNVIKVPRGWDMDAYYGMKIFFRYYGEVKAGNCGQCHYPPAFTDFSFHNTGVAPDEPGFSAFAGTAENAPGKMVGESNDAFAARMKGAFKTPTIKDLELTGPYMHNGAYATLEDVVRHYIKASQMARDGSLPNAPEALKSMYITEDEVKPLVAFLKQLKEVGVEHYRELIVEDIHVIKGPFDQW